MFRFDYYAMVADFMEFRGFEASFSFFFGGLVGGFSIFPGNFCNFRMNKLKRKNDFVCFLLSLKDAKQYPEGILMVLAKEFCDFYLTERIFFV